MWALPKIPTYLQVGFTDYIVNNVPYYVLKKLDKLTQEEAQMAVAETLKATHAVDESVRGVASTVVTIEDTVTRVDDQVAGVNNRVARVDDKIVIVNDRVASVDDKVVIINDKVAGVDDRVSVAAAPANSRLEP
jgi:hypothetical protein